MKPLTDEDQASRNYWRRYFPKAPTSNELHRHAEKFTSEGVKELAEVYGVDLTLSSKPTGPRSKKHMTPALREQILDLRERGLMPEAIADAMNLSDKRVRNAIDAVHVPTSASG